MVARVFLIVLDSFGVGALPDAALYGDEGSDTLSAIAKSKEFSAPNLKKLGLFNIQGVAAGTPETKPLASFARMTEQSAGKDTTIGHWEIAGIVSEKPLPTYPEGFPEEVILAFEEQTGRQTICNRPYSGTQVIMDYGREHEKTGALIVYTSADSVFQIAAHEEVIGVGELYRCCEIARGLLTGKHAVGRVIARPFAGAYPDYQRTARRHDYSLPPPEATMLDALSARGLDTIAVGKISDIFAGRGVSEALEAGSNQAAMERTFACLDKPFHGLCFINLVDFDMLYGHRNDVDGYARAIAAFDSQLPLLLKRMKKEDVLIITADHGCDPSTKSTDHSREHTPMLIYGDAVRAGVDLKTRSSFADIAATILDMLQIPGKIRGKSFWAEVKR